MTLHAVWAGLLVLLAVPALGQDRAGVNLDKVGLDKAGPGVRGGVAMLAQAQDLYGLGLAQKDAISVLAAARLVGAVTLRAVERKKTTEGVAAEGDARAPLDAGALLALARDLSGEDEALAGLIEAAEAEAAFGQIGVAQVTLSSLPAGGVDLWEIPLFGGSYAELAVLGNGGADLDVTVTDENGNVVCVDVGWTDRVYCDFTPAWNGYFVVRVENAGGRDNSYHLLTN